MAARDVWYEGGFDAATGTRLYCVLSTFDAIIGLPFVPFISLGGVRSPCLLPGSPDSLTLSGK